ncbi:MAG: hypothetical protein IJ587_12515 [Synergistaceae bacterium]|nr:hypothetical protein [Synergistaceae bacterium]
MKTLGLIIASGLLTAALCSAAPAHTYICELCGESVSAGNMSQSGDLCRKNPYGGSHSWVMDNEDGKTHLWICGYCASRTSSVHMPKPGDSCYRNPHGGTSHKWRKRN